MKVTELFPLKVYPLTLTLLHSERSKLYTILAFLSATGLNQNLVIGAVTEDAVMTKK